VIRGILVLPVIYWINDPWVSVPLLVLSSFFDILDGVYARYLQEIGVKLLGWFAELDGAVIDPANDKVFVLGVLITLALKHRVPLWLCALLIGLETLLLLIRPIKKHFHKTTRSNSYGKIKTWFQSFALAFVLTQNLILVWLSWPIYFGGLLLAAASLVSHIQDFSHPRNARPS